MRAGLPLLCYYILVWTWMWKEYFFVKITSFTHNKTQLWLLPVLTKLSALNIFPFLYWIKFMFPINFFLFYKVFIKFLFSFATNKILLFPPPCALSWIVPFNNIRKIYIFSHKNHNCMQKEISCNINYLLCKSFGYFILNHLYEFFPLLNCLWK